MAQTGPPAPSILPRPTKFQVPEATYASPVGVSLIWSMCFANSARTWPTSELRTARRSCIRVTRNERILRSLLRRESGRASRSFVVISPICRSLSASACLSGNSLQKIAKQLNAEGVVSPQPQKGRISRSWCPSSIRTILRNDRYGGRVIWGKTVNVRAKSDKRIYKRTPPDKWVVRELAEQRFCATPHTRWRLETKPLWNRC
jgi:hypothetical protein